MTSVDTKKTILVISPDYSVDRTSQWLPEELAREFARRGHEVRVIARDMIKPRPLGAQQTTPGEPEVFSVGVSRAPKSRFSRRFRLPLALLRQRFQAVPWVAQWDYDLVIYFTIAWTSSHVVRVLRRRGNCRRSVLMLWDFFPVHHQSIGHIPVWVRPLGAVLYRLESRAVAAADVVAVMSEAGADFLGKYFPRFTGATVIVPPWGEGRSVQWRGLEAFVAVFGGQLVAGRGLEDILDAAEIVQRSEAGVRFSIFGAGPLDQWLKAEIERRSLTNVTLEGQRTREEYTQAISGAAVGIAATVRGVPSPSFPSKIVDYARVGLPVIASVEESTDVGDIIASHGAGWAVRAGHPAELADALLRAHAAHRAGDLQRYREASRAFFEQHLDVRYAADQFLSVIENRPDEDS